MKRLMSREDELRSPEEREQRRKELNDRLNKMMKPQPWERSR